MCLAIPALVVEILSDDRATVDMGAVRKDVSIALLDGIVVGDYVIVHVGFALAKLNMEEAEKTLQFFSEVLSSEEVYEKVVSEHSSCPGQIAISLH